MATATQRVTFFKLWARASADICDSYGLDHHHRDQDRDARHRWIAECTGIRNGDINAVPPGSAFGRLMTLTAEAAGDYETASYWTIDAAKRARWAITHLLRQIGQITREDHPWAYVQGIFSRRHLPDDWMDIPDDELNTTMQILDTHRRRLLKRDHGWSGLRIDGLPLGFNPRTEYIYLPDGTLGYDLNPVTVQRHSCRPRAKTTA